MKCDEAESRARKIVDRVYFTCVVCGSVDEIYVPHEEGLPPKIYWECPACNIANG